MYKIGLYEKAMPNRFSLKEKLEFAKKANYDYLEICIDASEEKISRINLTKEERLDIIKSVYDIGIPIDSISISALTKYALGDTNDDISNRGIEILKGGIILAKDLGVRIVMIPGYDIYFGKSTTETYEKFIKNLKELVLFSANYGVILAFETMENDFMNTVTKARKYVDIVNSPYLQIYPDSGNVTNAIKKAGLDIVKDFEAGAGHIVAVHLKETVPGIFREVPYGTGHVDFKTVIKTAYSLGVRKFVTELWDIGKDDWEKDIFFANKMMRDILDKESKC